MLQTTIFFLSLLIPTGYPQAAPGKCMLMLTKLDKTKSWHVGNYARKEPIIQYRMDKPTDDDKILAMDTIAACAHEGAIGHYMVGVGKPMSKPNRSCTDQVRSNGEVFTNCEPMDDPLPASQVQEMPK